MIPLQSCQQNVFGRSSLAAYQNIFLKKEREELAQSNRILGGNSNIDSINDNGIEVFYAEGIWKYHPKPP